MATYVNFNPRFLKASLQDCAKTDIRYYLCGVLIESTKTETRYIATDGHRLSVLREEHEPTDMEQESIRIIVPYDDIRRMKVNKGTSDFCVMVSHDYDATKVGTWTCAAVGLAFTAIDGVFPDYRAVLKSSMKPSDTTLQEKADTQLNPAYPALMQKVVEQAFLTKGKIYINRRGVDAATCVLPEEDRFFGVIMPRRADEVTAPYWVTAS